ncbi:MAG: hypothetical protein NTV88_02785, partial [Candidatus Micrarchaeota archaeon]|nr:hypothetical protein [Candidatus Micrarchaeota archaeon]
MNKIEKGILYFVTPIAIAFGVNTATAQEENPREVLNMFKDSKNSITLSHSPLSITESNSVGLFQGSDMGLNTVSIDVGGKRMKLFSGEHPQVFNISLKGNGTFGNGHTFGFVGGELVGSSLNNSDNPGTSRTEGNFLLKAGFGYKWNANYFAQLSGSGPFSQKTDPAPEFINYYVPSVALLVHLQSVTVGGELWINSDGVQKVLANMQTDFPLTNKTSMGIQALLERNINSPDMKLLGGFNFRFAMPNKQSIEAGLLSGAERNIDGASFNAWRYGGYIMYSLP